MKRQGSAQAIIEYVVLLMIVIVTLLLMGYYVRNSLSGRYRETADTFGQGVVYQPFGGTQVIRNQTLNR
jgi:Flp pilus assembly pilin Flp